VISLKHENTSCLRHIVWSISSVVSICVWGNLGFQETDTNYYIFYILN